VKEPDRALVAQVTDCDKSSQRWKNLTEHL